MQKYDAFISYASEDKERVARPIAEALRNKGFRIWYDELELKIGKSLSESIDIGLSKSRFGIVILSTHFFSKSWPKRELRGLIAQEVAGKSIILPVWHGISKEEVLLNSPPLADLVSISTEKGIPYVINGILEALIGDSVLSNRLSKRSDYHANFPQAFNSLSVIQPMLRIATFVEGDNALRVGVLAALFAQKLGWSENRVEQMKVAASLRNIGLINVSDRILNEHRVLTVDEWESLKSHTLIGEQILSSTGDTYLDMSAIIAVSHHERWDGHGYPRGLKGYKIPEVSRIVAVVDVYDALTQSRFYRQPFSERQSLEIMESIKGDHLDPSLVDIFKRWHEDFRIAKKQFKL